MASQVMKLEPEQETCCICGNIGDLLTPEEFDASAPPLQVPLRSMLLHLNSNKVVPDGRLCISCARRAVESYDFSITLAAGEAPPLSEKIRALRRKLYELTQKIDVYIVVGGAGISSGTASYSEDDIIMVDKDSLAAAAAADDEDMERARNARGDTVYQCSVCPLSFQRLAEYRAHMATHPADALHSCWTCGAQFASREALRSHAGTHAAPHLLVCHLCDTTFQTASEMRRHEPSCPPRCPLCGDTFATRASLAAHAAQRHGRGAPPPLLCPACFAPASAPDLLSAHLLTHRQAKLFVCGYDGCILRFGTRSNLMIHIRKCHGSATEAAEAKEERQSASERRVAAHSCEACERTFATAAALKRHARVHKDVKPKPAPQEQVTEIFMDPEEVDGEVEYLEVETLEDGDFKFEGMEEEYGQEQSE